MPRNSRDIGGMGQGWAGPSWVRQHWDTRRATGIPFQWLEGVWWGLGFPFTSSGLFNRFQAPAQGCC